MPRWFPNEPERDSLNERLFPVAGDTRELRLIALRTSAASRLKPCVRTVERGVPKKCCEVRTPDGAERRSPIDKLWRLGTIDKFPATRCPLWNISRDTGCTDTRPLPKSPDRTLEIDARIRLLNDAMRILEKVVPRCSGAKPPWKLVFLTPNVWKRPRYPPHHG